MKYTNRLNLPEPIVKAVTNDPYTKGNADFSVTQLIAPARIRALTNRFYDDMTEDVSDRIWSLCGQIGHLILERAGADAGLVEKRFFASYEWNGKKYVISGQADLVAQLGAFALSDYKFTSIWTSKDGLKPEWEAQCNILRWLAAENGVDIKSMQIVAIYRDWSKGKAQRERDYPQNQIEVFNVPVWSREKTLAFIAGRVAAHVSASDPKNLPLCTAAERWAHEDTWAVVKPGNKRATAVFMTEDEANTCASHKAELTVVKRPGKSVRCESYCQCSEFCSQYKAELSAQNKESNETIL